MIYIEKGEVNTFALTLSEVTTIVDPFYLFVFEGEFNTASEPLYWPAIDTSNYPSRYNLFTLHEGPDVEFVAGQYIYKVYESSVEVLIVPNFQINGLNLIETGRLVVAGGSTSNIYD
jgi:hypothetical protein